jgi:Zn-dependent M28 family amino/carboxypeptidase
MPDSTIAELIARIDADRLREALFYLAKDPLPYRKINLTLPGHEKCTLYEADDYIAEQLETAGWAVEREAVQIQAFRCDDTKPKAHQYSSPAPEDPWYTGYNVYGSRAGASHADEFIVVMAHKDSQSWVDSPGAYDNAVGTAAVIEIAQALAEYAPNRAIRLLFCNEEHTPWTSVNAAQNARARGDNIVAAFNIDSLGGKSQEDTDAGRMTNATLYTVPEGRPLAKLMASMNDVYGLGLAQTLQQRTAPGDDDGSFVNAGYGATIMNLGSFPYMDPHYHLESDVVEAVDIPNVVAATKASLAAILTVDINGAPTE